MSREPSTSAKHNRVGSEILIADTLVTVEAPEQREDAS